MTIKLLFASSLLYLTSCDPGKASDNNVKKDSASSVTVAKIVINPIADSSERKPKLTGTEDSLKNKLKGLWTDGSTENAAFDIKSTTIYYVDQLASYKYILDSNIITIKYPDYTYKAKILFQGDTLIMDSEEFGESKFWRFKNQK